jgi:hypothetical protein
MEAASNLLFERLLAAFFAATFGLFASLIAWRKGYYKLPEETIKNIPHWRSVLEAFGIFLFIEMILMPLLYALWVMWEKGAAVHPEAFKFPLEFQAWANLGIIALAAIGLITYFLSLNNQTRDAIWGSSSKEKNLKQSIVDFLLGSITWVIAYPWIVVIGQVIAILLALFYIGPLPDQAAVQRLKDILEHPLLFGLTALAVVSIIPFLEELLFRGFLQSWLKTTLGRVKAILLTSLIFASFHFSMSQGIGNLEFITSLFVLSCFLGFVKERQRSLWASVGLHSTFNFISVLMLLSQ